MSESAPAKITFARLRSYLISLGFAETEARLPGTRTLYHRASKTLLVFTEMPAGEPVRPADFLSVLVRLEYQGLVSDAALDELRQGRLPKAS
jgi:hypothetical protein